jgi:threonine dehydratase
VTITLDDVRAAARRLDGVAHRTPAVTSRTLDERTASRVHLKAENLQRGGAFKFRGAWNAVAAMDPARRARGIITASSGNHAQAVALAAAGHGVPAVILMPEDAPASKLEATRGYGAAVVAFDRYATDREELLARVAAERGMTPLHAYDDPLIMAGQGTAALELLEQSGGLDVLVVPVGGGGLISGCATAAEGVRVVGVEPETGDDVRRSLAAGERVAGAVPRTIADGLQIHTPGELTWEVIRRRVSEVVTVSDAELIEAMRFAFERLKLVLEPSGAAGLAAILAGRVTGERIGVILTGGNVSTDRFRELMAP